MWKQSRYISNSERSPLKGSGEEGDMGHSKRLSTDEVTHDRRSVSGRDLEQDPSMAYKRIRSLLDGASALSVKHGATCLQKDHSASDSGNVNSVGGGDSSGHSEPRIGNGS